jgi:CRP-like cAMP-binding protein
VQTLTRLIRDNRPGPSRDAKVQALAGVPALAHCHHRELEVLAAAADECTLPPGHVLMWEGDPGGEAFLVLEGEAEVAAGGAVIAVVGPGQVLGEMALIDGRPRTATVVARTPLRVLVIGRRNTAALLDQPGVARGLLEILSARLRDKVGPPPESGRAAARGPLA